MFFYDIFAGNLKKDFWRKFAFEMTSATIRHTKKKSGNSIFISAATMTFSIPQFIQNTYCPPPLSIENSFFQPTVFSGVEQ
jgi:hypothetical protein